MAPPIPKIGPQSVSDPAALWGWINAITQNLQDVLEKIDADTTIGTDYESLHGMTAADIHTGARGFTE